MMEVMEEQAIFENAGQAVHVAFLVMAQEAMQDAPLRKALIRILESIKLADGKQQNWLDQLRGTHSGSINFAGLSGSDVRAQCAMITQAVKTNLPMMERWVLQAKFGEVEYEDLRPSDAGGIDAGVALDSANKKVEALRRNLSMARGALDAAGKDVGSQSPLYESARTSMAAVNARLVKAEREAQAAQVAVDQVTACRLLDNGPMPKGHVEGGHRRFAFSPERIAAILGLSEYFAPMFPRIKPLAIDLLLGRMFANHKKIEISTHDLARQFGGDHRKYLRASWKIKNHIRQLEDSALARLEPVFIAHGVVAEFK